MADCHEVYSLISFFQDDNNQAQVLTKWFQCYWPWCHLSVYGASWSGIWNIFHWHCEKTRTQMITPETLCEERLSLTFSATRRLERDSRATPLSSDCRLLLHDWNMSAANNNNNCFHCDSDQNSSYMLHNPNEIITITCIIHPVIFTSSRSSTSTCRNCRRRSCIVFSPCATQPSIACLISLPGVLRPP